MRRFLTHAAAVAGILTLAVAAQAGNPGHGSGHSNGHSNSHMNSNRMSPSGHDFQHPSNFSAKGQSKSYTKFSASKNFKYDKFGQHSLYYTHKYWSSKYNCWCCWAPYGNCWYFYEPCYACYLPVVYLPQVYSCGCETPLAAPVQASVIQQTTVTNAAPASVPVAPVAPPVPATPPPPPPVGA